MGTFENWERFVKQTKEQIRADKEKRTVVEKNMELLPRYAESPCLSER